MGRAMHGAWSERRWKLLLEAVGKGITAANEPKRIACGSPDFQIPRRGVPHGHVETKDIGTDLDEMPLAKAPAADSSLATATVCRIGS